MTVPDRKLRPGEIRFLPKMIDKLWRVFDRKRMSFPYHNPELGGAVLQDVKTQAEAQVEADRLNDLVGVTPAPEEPKKRGSRGRAKEEAKPVPAEEKNDGWIDESEIPDYGVKSADEAEKYVEGIL